MQRLIDANVLKYDIGEIDDGQYKRTELYVTNEAIAQQPTIDAVPSETLYDFIREIGAITYGKERFFHEEIGVHCGLWYDRKSGEWITTKTATEECLKAVRELNDGVLDEVPVKRGKWIKADSQQYFRKHYPCFTCSECGYRKDSQKTWNYCPNCGADMRGESDD